MHVDSDFAVVRDRVNEIAATVVANGGYIHPELVVHHSGASLWLSLPREANPYLLDHNGRPLEAPHPDAEPLLVIPDELFIPVSNLDWEPHDSVLRYRASTEHLTGPQRRILDAMVELFNAVDKVREIGQRYPGQALADDPELLNLVRRARPRMVLGDGDPAVASPSLRVLNSRLRTGMGEDDEGPISFFMPMIDMLNNHPFGSRYRRTSTGAWRIDVHHPTAGEEVFLRYNRADALGIALGLGYPERATRHVSSVECTLDVPNLGTVHVHGVGAIRRRLPAPRVVPVNDGWEITGLVIEPDRIATLRTLLSMPLQANAPARDTAEIQRIVDDLITEIVAANADFFSGLLELCTTANSGSADPELRALFAEVSKHQLQLLSAIADSVPKRAGDSPTS